ncbi:MAG: DUF1018 domain-containing protein [Phycisphaerales bacterium]|nr:DUF1018 domain-containing protein [Phycisphaerales bacterium]
MLTKPQIILLQTARRQVPQLRDDAPWRMALRNIARVSSAKDLNNRSFENMLAFLEEMGFCDQSKRPDHYRRKVAARGHEVSDEQLYKMGALAQAAGLDLDGFCRRMSCGRTDDPGRLEPFEAYNVIEALKAIVDRKESVPEGGKVAAAPRQGSPGGTVAAAATEGLYSRNQVLETRN